MSTYPKTSSFTKILNTISKNEDLAQPPLPIPSIQDNTKNVPTEYTINQINNHIEFIGNASSLQKLAAFEQALKEHPEQPILLSKEDFQHLKQFVENQDDNALSKIFNDWCNECFNRENKSNKSTNSTTYSQLDSFDTIGKDDENVDDEKDDFRNITNSTSQFGGG